MLQLREILYESESLVRQFVISMVHQAEGKKFSADPVGICASIGYFIENGQADLKARPHDMKGHPIPPQEQCDTTVDGIVAAEEKQGDGTEREGVAEIDTTPPEKPEMPSVDPEPRRPERPADTEGD